MDPYYSHTLLSIVYCYHITFHLEKLPQDLCIPDDLQNASASFEILFQIALLYIQAYTARGSSWPVSLQTQIDNTPTVTAISKFYSSKEPLSHLVQLLVWWSEHFRVRLSAIHIPGILNDWADGISRWTPECVAQLDPTLRVTLTLATLSKPFREATHVL